MIYLSGAVTPDLPAMLTPQMWNKALPKGQIWAADSGRFAAPEKYTDERYLKWLSLRDNETCLFATAPDVLGDAKLTLAMSAPMFIKLKAIGYKPALVAQDGLENLMELVPWNDFDTFFIGGSTEWKLGQAAQFLVVEAKKHGKWIHMGRVNSLRRLRYASQIGCDSTDGTYIAFRRRLGPGIGEEEIRRWLAMVNEEKRKSDETSKNMHSMSRTI